jgi:hypothetical protein
MGKGPWMRHPIDLPEVGIAMGPHTLMKAQFASPSDRSRICSHKAKRGLAFGPFAPVIVQCPAFLPCRLPGKLVQGVAQRFQAGEAFVRFGIIATLERHGSRAGQALDTGGIVVATAILTPFGKPPRSQALARSRQRTPDLLVLMRQKKGADLLIVAGNLRDHHQQLLDQRQHQALLGAHDDLLGDQLGAMHLLKDLGGSPPRVGMLARAQRRGDLFKRGCLSRLGRGVRLQKHEGGALLHLGKQVLCSALGPEGLEKY